MQLILLKDINNKIIVIPWK